MAIASSWAKARSKSAEVMNIGTPTVHASTYFCHCFNQDGFVSSCLFFAKWCAAVPVKLSTRYSHNKKNLVDNSIPLFSQSSHCTRLARTGDARRPICSSKSDLFSCLKDRWMCSRAVFYFQSNTLPEEPYCNGYLGHPFKTMHFEKEKVLPPLVLATCAKRALLPC